MMHRQADWLHVTTAIIAGRYVARGDEAAVVEVTVRLARRAGPDAVKRVVITDGGWATVLPRMRAACRPFP
jgi:hypothetical protein